MTTTVVHVNDGCDVYCGRRRHGMHFGNPASHGPGLASVKVGSREQAIQFFDDWLAGKHPDVEPDRRRWVLDNIPSLKGKRLGCFCRPKTCHCDVLVRLAENI